MDGRGEDGQQRRAMRPEAMEIAGVRTAKVERAGMEGRDGDEWAGRQGDEARVACNPPILKTAASSGGSLSTVPTLEAEG